MASLDWLEVSRRVATGAVGVLPIGAAAKQHGHHLPMNTDQIQTEWIATRLTEQFNILVWPTVNYGYFPAFTEYPGSCSISEDIFQSLVAEILKEIRRHDVKIAIVLNSGISTQSALRRACEAVANARLINIYDGPSLSRLSRRILQQTYGGHADERETSMMLAIDDESVIMEKTKSWDKPMRTGPLRRHDHHDCNYSPSGIIGDPTLASKKKGHMLLEAMMEDISEHLRRILP